MTGFRICFLTISRKHKFMNQNTIIDNYMYFNPFSWFYFLFHVEEFWYIGYILLSFSRCILGIREVFLFTKARLNTYSVLKRFLTDQHLKLLNSKFENLSFVWMPSNGSEARSSVNFKNSFSFINPSLACLLTHALAAMSNVAKMNTHVLQFPPACLQARTHAWGRLLSAGENNTVESLTGVWHDLADALKHVCTSVH